MVRRVSEFGDADRMVVHLRGGGGTIKPAPRRSPRERAERGVPARVMVSHGHGAVGVASCHV